MQQLLLLLLSRFSRVQLCATPETAAHQAPPSLGFSRSGCNTQENICMVSGEGTVTYLSEVVCEVSC